jgi:hypothetical protein
VDHGRPRTEDSEGRQACVPEGLYLHPRLRRVCLPVPQPSVTYRPAFVVAGTGEVIALRCIESMNLTRDGQQELFDTIKGDYLILIETVGGKSYSISVQNQIDTMGTQYDLEKDLLKLRDDIFSKWLEILKNI